VLCTRQFSYRILFEPEKEKVLGLRTMNIEHVNVHELVWCFHTMGYDYKLNHLLCALASVVAFFCKSAIVYIDLSNQFVYKYWPVTFFEKNGIVTVDNKRLKKRKEY
jgi:hypothetical protein